MRKIIYTLLLGAIFLSSCSDSFLDRTPEDRYVSDNFYNSDEALAAAASPLYTKGWFDYHSSSMVTLGDFRANDGFSPYYNLEYVTFQVGASHATLGYAWKGLYSMVSLANSVIEAVDTKSTGDVSEKAKAITKGEARLMRGITYFNLLRLWGPVILFENNQEIVDHPIRPLNREEDVFKFIINDFTYAAENLPEDAMDGRATCWSAKALLAKAYLARSGWDKTDRDENDLEKARFYASDVCLNSGLNLLPKYEDLFKYKFNNNEESLLAMQWVPLGEWGVRNTLHSDLQYSETAGGVMTWCSITGTYDQMMQYEPTDTIRMNATFYTQGAYYDYLNIADGGFSYTGEGAPLKKGGVGGPQDDNDGKVEMMSSPLNTYIIRLADAYLTLAEASLGNNTSLSTGTGLEYFNKVRARAGLNPKGSITFEDIIKERRCEFAMEHTNWFDMVSWYKWKPDYMLEYFNNQDRSVVAKVVRDANNNRVITKEREANIVIEITKDKIFLPYPENDVIQNPLLKQDPQPYTFNE